MDGFGSKGLLFLPSVVPLNCLLSRSKVSRCQPSPKLVPCPLRAAHAAPSCLLSPQDDQLLDDTKTLGECGFTSQTARPQAPATVGLAFRAADDAFEALRIEPFSSPPELPDVMKPQDSGSSANEQAVQ
uniref:Elongin B n=1 Tax=Ornithorhynchus anatinus TaxID=9258 RepID=A0A6I8PBM8_ORNAN